MMSCCNWLMRRQQYDDSHDQPLRPLRINPSLMKLRRDELRVVMLYLDYISILALALSSRHAFAAARTQYVWSGVNQLPAGVLARFFISRSHVRQEKEVPIPVLVHEAIDNTGIAVVVEESKEDHRRCAPVDHPSRFTHLKSPPSYGAALDHDSSLVAAAPISGMTMDVPTLISDDLCFLQYIGDFDLDAVGERSTTMRQFLYSHVEPKCRRGCELSEEIRLKGAGTNIHTSSSTISIPEPSNILVSLPLTTHVLDVSEMVQLLDRLKEFESNHATSSICRSNSLNSTLASHLHRLRYRGVGTELILWRPVLSHPSLQHLYALELHSSLPIDRPVGDVPSTYLPLGILSLLTPIVLSQLTSLKVVHPHPNDTLSQLILMPHLTTLAIRGVSTPSFDSIRQCSSLTHFRLMDGTKAYRYDQGTPKLFLGANVQGHTLFFGDSAVRHVQSLYLGWNCQQPFESPWAITGNGGEFDDLDYSAIYFAFTTQLTNLTQLELEGYLTAPFLIWEWWGHDDRFDSDPSGNEMADNIAQSINWSRGYHGGVLSGCHSLRRLIVYGEYCEAETFEGILRVLPHLSITLYLAHPSCTTSSWYVETRQDLMRLAPRLILREHPEANRNDYVTLHGEMF